MDVDGHEHTAAREGGVGGASFTRSSVVFRGLPLARIKELRFQVRPYHWVRIAEVPLRRMTNLRLPECIAFPNE
jgi:hypothetical protein